MVQNCPLSISSAFCCIDTTPDCTLPPKEVSQCTCTERLGPKVPLLSDPLGLFSLFLDDTLIVDETNKYVEMTLRGTDKEWSTDAQEIRAYCGFRGRLNAHTESVTRGPYRVICVTRSLCILLYANLNFEWHRMRSKRCSPLSHADVFHIRLIYAGKSFGAETSPTA